MKNRQTGMEGFIAIFRSKIGLDFRTSKTIEETE
jgi:hypothetical protein